MRAKKPFPSIGPRLPHHKWTCLVLTCATSEAGLIAAEMVSAEVTGIPARPAF